MKTILTGHTSEATAYTQQDYPYGRLRCSRRVWVETRKGFGQRMVTQTQNPKNGRWNAHKPGNYHNVIVIFLNDDNGHVETDCLGTYDSLEKIQEFETQWGANLDQHQQAAIKFLQAVARASKRVTVTITAGGTNPGEERQTIQEQQQIMRDLTLDELRKGDKQ